MNCRFPPSLHCHLDRPMVASSRNIVSHDIKLCILWSLVVTERNLSQEQDTLRMIIYDPKDKSLVWLVPGIAWFPSPFLLLSREQVPGETLNCPEFLAGKRRHVIHSDQWEEMEVCLKNKLCIFFFMLKMKTWLATLCLLPLTLLSLWSLDSRLRLVVQRVRRMQTPLCTLYLQILINVKANKNLYLIQPQELDFCYMPLNKILCDTATRGSLQMSVSHYLIVWYS